MIELYNYIKALHLIFIVTYFAGLFYVPRLMMYFVEASMLSKNESKVLMPRLKIMMNRLWKIITVPSAILTLVFGLWLLILMPALITQTWMILKLFFIFLLVLYHIKTNLIYIDIMNDRIKYSANFFRYWNEGATLILFSIVFLATLKNSFSWVFGFVGIILLSILLIAGIKIYKNSTNLSMNSLEYCIKKI